MTHRVAPRSKAKPEKKAVLRTRVAVKKSAVKTRNPVVETKKPGAQFPVVLPNPPLVTTPVNVPAGNDSNWNLSDRGVLSITILIAIAVGFYAWWGWRRLRFHGWVSQHNAQRVRVVEALRLAQRVLADRVLAAIGVVDDVRRVVVDAVRLPARGASLTERRPVVRKGRP